MSLRENIQYSMFSRLGGTMLNENAVHLLPGISFSEKPFGITYYAFLLSIEH